jgi:hypothetical protein
VLTDRDDQVTADLSITTVRVLVETKVVPVSVYAVADPGKPDMGASSIARNTRRALTRQPIQDVLRNSRLFLEGHGEISQSVS